VNLDTHILDVVNLIRWEELSDVVLCGHSYGGCVITGAVDRIPERIRSLVYLDAFVLEDGENLSQHVPEGLDLRVIDGWQVSPIPAKAFNVNSNDRDWVNRQCRITATTVVYSVPSSTARNVAPCPSHANAHSVLRGQRGLFSTDSGVNGALWRSSSPLAIVTGHSEEGSDSCCTKIAAFDGFPHHGFLDKPRKPVFRLIVIKSYRLEAEVRFLKLLSARLVFM